MTLVNLQIMFSKNKVSELEWKNKRCIFPNFAGEADYD